MIILKSNITDDDLSVSVILSSLSAEGKIEHSVTIGSLYDVLTCLGFI